ncbi:hypothetical protein E2C01_031781 [Portunus trituberculatus]|uniref:Uncharacterized protein n=1 Tax=Portunus trituberculatus TaxID=210409 RepID=A0A5B7EXV3_PORTR|nr:hypothetical protein [Portunus trituberculatus]
MTKTPSPSPPFRYKGLTRYSHFHRQEPLLPTATYQGQPIINTGAARRSHHLISLRPDALLQPGNIELTHLLPPRTFPSKRVPPRPVPSLHHKTHHYTSPGDKQPHMSHQSSHSGLLTFLAGFTDLHPSLYVSIFGYCQETHRLV